MSKNKKTIIIATIKSWNIENAEAMKRNCKNYDIVIITEKEKLNEERLRQIRPEYIFFPHWSWIIPEHIYCNYECVVFHMTDLPYGRGGSPLQNLIIRGKKHTKISAIKVDASLDAGDVYHKCELDLSGRAKDIFINASDIIFKEMIPYILKNKPIPKPQQGDIVEFQRLTAKEGDIKKCQSTELIYDKIRMLDAEGYPKAYLELDGITVRFNNARYEDNKVIAEAIFEEDKG